MSTVGILREELDREERERELDRELESQARLDDEDLKKRLERNLQIRGRRTLLAAEKGRLLELLNVLKEDKSLINYSDADGYTPLHRASYGGHKDCVKYLIKHGAEVNARTTDDWTPLHCAVRWNNLAVAEYLVQNGANVNAKSSGGNTPLHIVASNGRYSITCDLIQLLLFHPECDYTIRNDSGDTAYDIAKRSGPFHKLWNGVMTVWPEGIIRDE